MNMKSSSETISDEYQSRNPIPTLSQPSVNDSNLKNLRERNKQRFLAWWEDYMLRVCDAKKSHVLEKVTSPDKRKTPCVQDTSQSDTSSNDSFSIKRKRLSSLVIGTDEGSSESEGYISPKKIRITLDVDGKRKLSTELTYD